MSPMHAGGNRSWRRGSARVRAPALVVALLAGACVAPPPTQEPVAREADAFVAGYVEAVLHEELGIAPESCSVRVEDGAVLLSVAPELAPEAERLRERLLRIQGVASVLVETRGPDQGDEPATDAVDDAAADLTPLGASEQPIPLPPGDVFQPLIADPKQPQFAISFREYDSEPTGARTIAAVSYGETFGLHRSPGDASGDGYQVSLAGGLFAEFDLDASSNDLINADYTLGIPFTARRGPWSVRVRVYHQSSHLGDELLLGEDPPRRVNLSFESLEVLGSRDLGAWRAYLGGEYLFHRSPNDLDPGGLHGGLELRSTRRFLDLGRIVGGVDVKSWEEHDWEPSASVKIGLEFGAAESGRRRLRWLLEAYDGFSPHGQFYQEEIEYLGTGVTFGF